MDGIGPAGLPLAIGALVATALGFVVVGACFDFAGAVLFPDCPCGAIVASFAAVAIAAAIPVSSAEDAAPFFALVDAAAAAEAAAADPPAGAGAVVVTVDVGVGIGRGILLPYGDCMDLLWFDTADICDDESFPVPPACRFIPVAAPAEVRTAPTECEIPFPTGRFCDCEEV